MNDGISELSTDRLGQPNASEYFCEGKLKIGQGVSLILASKDLKHGKWDVNPAIEITGPFDGTAFLASGKPGDNYGTDGTIKCTASDDAAFFLNFNVPIRGSNAVGIRCEGTDCNLYSYSVSRVPESGSSSRPIYTIIRK